MLRLAQPVRQDREILGYFLSQRSPKVSRASAGLFIHSGIDGFQKKGRALRYSLAIGKFLSVIRLTVLLEIETP